MDVDPKDQEKQPSFLRSASLIGLVGICSGSASALFLWSLDLVTNLRFKHPQLLYGLPFAGALMLMAYRHFGKNSAQGNNLILENIHQPGGAVPRRMAPLVLVSTLISHLFGGSVGREGTAVQMGGSIASAIAHRFKLVPADLPLLLSIGMASGFGAVFGTPLAGTVFSMEVPTRGRVTFGYVIPCLAASFIGHWTCLAWGIRHTAYPALSIEGIDWGFSMLVRLASLCALLGLVASLFSRCTHGVQQFFESRIQPYWMRPILGALCVIALTRILGTEDYLGLGVSNPLPNSVTLISAFQEGGATPWSWIWKLVMTALTLGAGFKGGEVTPLFFIGATLGNVCANPLGIPVEVAAALGFVSVFCAAAHTPWTGAMLGMEIFGLGSAPLFLVGCRIAEKCCGKSGIYSAQRGE